MVEVGSVWVNNAGREFKILKVSDYHIEVLRVYDGAIFMSTLEDLDMHTTFKQAPVLDLENE
jgi:hypothetical protein